MTSCDLHLSLTVEPHCWCDLVKGHAIVITWTKLTFHMFQERLHKTSTHSSQRKKLGTIGYWGSHKHCRPTQNLSVLSIPVYSESQCTQYPSVLSIPVHSGSQCTQDPSVLRIPVYSGSQCTQDPSVLRIPVYSRSQCTQDPSVLRIHTLLSTKL